MEPSISNIFTIPLFIRSLFWLKYLSMEPTRKSAKEKLMLKPAPAIFPRDTTTFSANVFAADKTSGDVKIPFRLFPIPSM